jgi:hypothetical protein
VSTHQHHSPHIDTPYCALWSPRAPVSSVQMPTKSCLSKQCQHSQTFPSTEPSRIGSSLASNLHTLSPQTIASQVKWREPCPHILTLNSSTTSPRRSLYRYCANSVNHLATACTSSSRLEFLVDFCVVPHGGRRWGMIPFIHKRLEPNLVEIVCEQRGGSSEEAMVGKAAAANETDFR